MVSIRETMNDFYYRKSPQERKIIRKAQRHVGLDKDFDHNGGLTSSLDMLFTGADIFSNDLSFMMNRFVSPISSALATSYYKYYIMDTVQVDGIPCIDMAFVPFNVKSYGFTGRLYVTADGNYSIKKVQLNFPASSNINWIDRLRIDQEFEQTEDGLWALKREDSYVNVTAFKGVQGIFAHQTRYFSDYRTDSTGLAQSPVFRIDGPVEILPDSGSHDDSYWDSRRSLPLDSNETAIAQVSDVIARKSRAIIWLRVLDAFVSEWVPSSGSKPTSKFDFGPILSFVGYDYIEGLRLRIGVMTTANLSKRWFGNGYLAYGVNDRKIKGSITLTHSFNDKHYHPGERPLNNLSATYTYDIYSPEEIGEQHDIVTSLKTGAVKKLQYIRRINMTYEKQWLKSLRTSFWIENARYTPAWLPGLRGEGTLKYEMLTADGAAIDIPHITSTELGTQIVKLREMLMFNGVYGSLTEKNDPLRSNRPGLLLLPENTRPFGNMPYMEVGVGIENIFRLFRVMYFYRLTYRSDSMTWLEKWGGLRFGIYADF